MLLKKGKTTKNQSKNENLTAKSQKRKEKSKKKRTKRVLQRTQNGVQNTINLLTIKCLYRYLPCKSLILYFHCLHSKNTKKRYLKKISLFLVGQ